MLRGLAGLAEDDDEDLDDDENDLYDDEDLDDEDLDLEARTLDEAISRDQRGTATVGPPALAEQQESSTELQELDAQADEEVVEEPATPEPPPIRRPRGIHRCWRPLRSRRRCGDRADDPLAVALHRELVPPLATARSGTGRFSAITLSVYAHLFDRTDEAAVRAFDRWQGEIGPKVGPRADNAGYVPVVIVV